MALRREKVAERLTELRETHGLSQEQAAHRIGISIRQYQRWEVGDSYPQPANLDRIATSYGMSIDELTGEDTTVTPRNDRLERLERRLADLEARFGEDSDD